MSGKLYNVLNIILALSCLLIAAAFFILGGQNIMIGVLFRGVLALLVLFNGAYLLFTNKKSFLILKGRESLRKYNGMLLLIVGAAIFITALMGYGLNGYSRLWR
jgi:hypothetical protein